jgi:hypothetical protein
MAAGNRAEKRHGKKRGAVLAFGLLAFLIFLLFLMRLAACICEFCVYIIYYAAALDSQCVYMYVYFFFLCACGRIHGSSAAQESLTCV